MNILLHPVYRENLTIKYQIRKGLKLIEIKFNSAAD